MIFLLDRFFSAEDPWAIHLGDSISHEHSLPLKARGSAGALTLQIREDGHGIPGLHVWQHRQILGVLFTSHMPQGRKEGREEGRMDRYVIHPQQQFTKLPIGEFWLSLIKGAFDSYIWGKRQSQGRRHEHPSVRRSHTERRRPPQNWAGLLVWEKNRKTSN